MEPKNEHITPSQELPAPLDQGDVVAEHAATPETSGNRAHTPPIAVPVVSQPAIDPVGSIAAPAPTPIPTTATSTTSDLLADDSDLIEKEWVLKAKAIVAQTKSDPYAQNQSMSRVKADYLKKRYNKDLKLNEG